MARLISSGAFALDKRKNLDELTDAVAARLNLGLGTAATKPAGGWTGLNADQVDGLHGNHLMRRDVPGINDAGSLNVRSAGNRHLWFEQANGNVRALVYHSQGDDTMRVELRDIDGVKAQLRMHSNGDIVAGVGRFVGSGHKLGLGAANVGAATAALNTGAVGSYAMLKNLAGGVTSPGQLRSGGDLRWSSASTSATSGPVGTWRCMGYTTYIDNNMDPYNITLWLRVA